MHLDAATFFSLLFASIVSLALWLWRDRWRRRAIARDHHAAASRHPVIPDCCAGCRSPHATHPLVVGTYFAGVAPRLQLMDPRFPRSYTFRCCLACARPIHRRRRTGTILAITGAALFAAGFVFIVLVELWDAFAIAFRTHSRAFLAAYGLDPALQLYLLLVLLGLGFTLAMGGLGLRASSPFVHVLDGGGEQIYFRFHDQAFRDQFAAINEESTLR